MRTDYRIRIGEREERVGIEEQHGRYRVTIGEREFEVDAVRLNGSSTLSLLIDGHSREAEVVPEGSGYLVQVPSGSLVVEVQDEVLARAGRRAQAQSPAGPRPIVSPMPGLVVEVRAAPGSRIAAGDPLVIVEAMKMQNELAATADAVVKDVRVRPGQTVAAGEVLVTFDGTGRS
jgi:acetyl-CoA/propionyl-CoA carboxylase biotin carboxyl carrier protein